MNKRNIGIGVATLLLLIVGAIWAIRSRADPQLEKVRELRKEAFSRNGPPDREKMQQLREEMRQLSPEQRDQLQQDRERQMDKRIADFFRLPPAQQTAELDKMIKDEEQWRKERESRRAQAGQSQDQGNAPGSGSNGNAGPPPGRRNMTPEERMQQRNKRLDNSPPEQRAQRTAMHAAVQQRRKQLGLPADPPRPGWR